MKIKSESEMDDIDDIETVPYVSPKRENDIDDREAIAYASPKREGEDEIDKKIYNKPNLETAVEIEEQIAEREKNYQKWIGTRQGWYSSFKRIWFVFNKAKEEGRLNVEIFFIDDNDIFDSEEISNANRDLTVCSYYVTYAFQSESTLWICLNVKEFLARNRCDIWSLSERSSLVNERSPI